VPPCAPYSKTPTKHKKFFTQEEFEANKGIIYRINSAADTLTKNLKDEN